MPSVEDIPVMSGSTSLFWPYTAKNPAEAQQKLRQTTSFTVKEDRRNQFDVPDKSWGTKRLGEFAKVENQKVADYGRRLAVHTRRLGHALHLAHEKIKYGKWGEFLKRYRISEATDWRARQLYEKSASEEVLTDMTITEAYKKFSVSKPSKNGKAKKKKTEKQEALPKENPKTMTMFLAKLLDRLELAIDEAAFLDQDNQPIDHCLNLIDQIIAKLDEIKRTIPNRKDNRNG